MSTTYNLNARRRPTARAWLAVAAAGVAVVVLLALIAVACQGGADREPAARGGSPSPETSAALAGAAGTGTTGATGPAGTAGAGQSGGGPGHGEGTGGEPGTGGTGEDEPASPAPVAAAPEDCLPYDPEDLSVVAAGDDWQLRSGAHAMKVFASETDAQDAVKVARNWTRYCFIGRGNDRPDRYRYITHYWQEPSGLPLGLAPGSLDCISYDPPNLGVSEHAGSWWLLDGPAELLPLDSAADAERARLVAEQFTQLCFVGRGNDRPDPDRYVLTYWR